MLSCCFCLFPPANEAKKQIKAGKAPEVAHAITVVGGFAVCSDHLHVVCRGSVWHELVTIARH